ncbi:MAG: acyloxyacyl hydrolase [Deltaproteobacteria bacterium]|nr:acyloxyacyl hydrolase [Deltaproteobacteria bacterium]
MRSGSRAYGGLRALLMAGAFAAVAFSSRALADEVPSVAPRRGPNEFGAWGGGSVASTTMIGEWTDFGYGQAAFRYARTLWSNDVLALDWTVDAIPLALLSLDRGGSPGSEGGPKDVVYGAGIAPIGLRLACEGLTGWRPYFATNVGFVMFEERVPATGTKFNYTWDFGVGVQIFVRDDQALTLGYDWKHISNAYSGETNPGFDASILYVGYSYFR